MTTALFIGRFQPFHNGHLSVVNKILKKHELIIAIGSSNKSRTLENPFTAKERKEMIESALLGKKYEIVFLPDLENHSEWVKSVKLIKADIVFTGNDFLKSLLTNAIDVKKEVDICATKIRKKISEGEEYKDLVPFAVYVKLKEIKAEERLLKYSK